MVFLFPLNLYPIEYIQKFYKVYNHKNFDIEKELIKNNCTKIPLETEIFLKNNTNNWQKKKKLKIQTCFQSKTFSDEELNIKEWEEITVPRGFILSLELEKRKCDQIYTQQIPHFYLKNEKKPKDVNIISIGKNIKIQKCEINPNKKTEELKTPMVNMEDQNSNQSIEKEHYDTSFNGMLSLYNKNIDNRSSYGINYDYKSFNYHVLLSKSYTNFEFSTGIVYKSIMPKVYFGYEHGLKTNNGFYVDFGIKFMLTENSSFSYINNYKNYKNSYVEIESKIYKRLHSELFIDHNKLGIGFKINLD
jgi:hypothetical protein